VILEPTSQQLTYLNIHKDKCKSYYGEDADNFQAEVSRMQRRYERVLAKTDAEKQLKQALDVFSGYYGLRNQLKQARKGGPKDRKLYSEYYKKLRDINKKIQKHRKQGQSNYALNVVIAGQETNEDIIQLQGQYEQIEKLMEQNHFIDKALISQLEDKKINLFQEFESFLSKNDSADAFLLLTNVFLTDIKESEGHNEFINRIKSKFKYYDTTNFESLNKIGRTTCSVRV